MAINNQWGSKERTNQQNTRKKTYEGTFLGIIKDNKDPQKMGRLRVWVPELGSPEDEEYGWITVTYCSPFAGATDYDRVERTGATENDPANSQTSYGFWMVPPDLNNAVIVMFVNGDPNKGIWLGCLYQQKLNHMIPGVAYGNTFDTDDKRPTTEHNRKTEDNVTDDMKRAEIIDSMSEGLKFQGLIQDRARGITDSGARREAPSEVYGILTPGPKRDETVYTTNQRETRYGGSQFVMDDGKGREKIRLRTRSGAQLLLDESNGTVYLTNRDGTAWVHMDEFGRIDIYGAETMAVRSEKDFVIRADRDIVMEAGRDVSIKANRDWEENQSESQHKGEIKGEGGNILLHANKDLGMIVTQDMTTVVNENAFLNVGGNSNNIIYGKLKSQVDKSIDTIVNTGNYTLSVNGNYQHNTGGSTLIFAGDDVKIDALNDIEEFAFSGKIDLGSQLDMSLKTKKGNMSMVAEDEKGNLSIRSNNSVNQINMDDSQMGLYSNKTTNVQSKEAVNTQVNEEFDVNEDGEITKADEPIKDKCLRFDGGVNISFSQKKIEFDAVEDLAIKVQDGIDTSANTINDSLKQIEETVNQLSEVTFNYISEMMKFFKIPNVLDWVNDLPISIPIPIPNFQIPSLPTIRFPSLQLPEFPFDFCIDLGNIIKIGAFNPLPDGLFGEINVDLGNWSKRSIKKWANEQKLGFSKLVENLRIDKQISNVFDKELLSLKVDIDIFRNKLNNLSSLSLLEVSVRDNVGAYGEYSIALDGLKKSLDDYKTKAESIPDSTVAKAIREKEQEEEAQEETVIDGDYQELVDELQRRSGIDWSKYYLTEAELDAFVRALGGTSARVDFFITPTLSHLKGAPSRGPTPPISGPGGGGLPTRPIRYESSNTDSDEQETIDDITRLAPDIFAEASELIESGETPDAATNVERLINEIESHRRDVERIARQAELNPEQFNNVDFSELQELVEFFDEILDQLNEFIDEIDDGGSP